MSSVESAFRSQNGEDMTCPLCQLSQDDQPQYLLCVKLREKLSSDETANNKVKYEDIFDNTYKQKEAVVLISKLLNISEKLLEEKISSEQ